MEQKGRLSLLPTCISVVCNGKSHASGTAVVGVDYLVCDTAGPSLKPLARICSIQKSDVTH